MAANINKVDKVIRIFYSKGGHVERKDVQLACAILNNHGVIGVPTDTLYGIAARADSSEALDRIYKIKGRDPDKPLAVCVSNFDQIRQVADENSLNLNVIKCLLPGPLTLVLRRSNNLNKDLNKGLANIGVRIPDHSFVRAISGELDCPIALTSANRSGETSPLSTDDFKDIWDDLDAIFDVGFIRGGLPSPDSKIAQRFRAGSTVVDLTEERTYRIIREGCGLNRLINVLNRFGYMRKK